MPMLGGTRMVGGNLDQDTQSKVNGLVQQFEKAVDQAAKERQIRRAVVRSQLSCNSIVVVDRVRIYLACERAGDMPSTTYLDHQEREFDLDQIADAAVWEFGFQDPFVVALPRELLDQVESERPQAVAKLAEGWVEKEVRRVVKLTRLVRLNPIFGPSEFLPDPRLCFVMMSFDLELDRIYSDVIKPCVEEQNLVCRRADEIRSNRAIIHDIWKSICEARLIVVDLTSHNPNVFYELGMAHTVGRPTILLSQKDVRKFPFDVMHLRRIVYEDTASGGQKLRKELAETIQTVLAPISLDIERGTGP